MKNDHKYISTEMAGRKRRHSRRSSGSDESSEEDTARAQCRRCNFSIDKSAQPTWHAAMTMHQYEKHGMHVDKLCSICAQIGICKIYPRECDWKDHMTVAHPDGKQIPTPPATTTLSGESSLSSRQEEKRKSNKPRRERTRRRYQYNCDVCNIYSCNNKDAFKDHIRKKHPEVIYRASKKSSSESQKPWDYTCKMCEKVFKSQQTLNVHKRLCAKGGFVCPVCKSAYISMSGMQGCRNRCTGRFSCRVCQKNFSSNFVL